MKSAAALFINRYKKSVIVILIALITVYLLFCCLIYIFQDNLIFFPQKDSIPVMNQASGFGQIEDITIATKDGIRISGWLVNNSDHPSSNLLIYFGGNAEELSRTIDNFRRFHNWSVALMNYRGYGSSEGKPSEKTMFNDSLEIYDYFSNREDIHKDNIVVMGRSIGTGVAAYLAENRKVSAVILVSPYDSLSSVAQEQYPFFPVNLLLRHKFDTISRAPKINVPLLAIVGTQDTTIPQWHSGKVAEVWSGAVTTKEINGDHNSISQEAEYWDQISEFLQNNYSSK